ncbi:hypothetical protein CI109_103638 [Kwoniella shandongensis]|uniref:Ribosomal protein S9 n=1 Tax=Kwoniella shandongensis TaxID=1734106 RepID=A0A5M6C7I4_9TREE|nr:uncharacterized protein CI109_000670 [Kwoniella shandongensis]KAA5531098.1 hypothetical protein CI109_000670 [Kwoniella shandongensis]
MAFPSTSSSLRGLRTLSLPLVRGYASVTPYSPPNNDHSNTAPTVRPSRPSSPQFFTGRPTFHESLSALSSIITSTTSTLRSSHIYPLPSSLPHIPPPRASWVSPEELSSLFQVKLKTNTLRQVMELLTELHHLRHISDMAGYPELVSKIDQALEKYEGVGGGSASGGASAARVKEKEEKESQLDEFGRAYASGRKKTSSARVWMIPSPTAKPILEAQTGTGTETAGAISDLPSSEILINHVPITTYFPRPSDRETILRPLRLTGLIGAFNIFAFARGGGLAGQAGAVGLGVARALAILREDTKDILRADGALMRDTRTTERKKTGRAKARKAYTWVKR